MTNDVQPVNDLSPQHLKNELRQGAVTENVNVINRHFPNTHLAAPEESKSRLPLLAGIFLVVLCAAPYVAAAVSPDAVARFAPWLYKVPGTSAVRAAVTPPRTEDHGLRRRAPVSKPPAAPTLTASAEDRIEDLNLRFSEPPKLNRDVFDLAVRRIIVDPGHGGEHKGTSSGDLMEKNITLDIGLRLRDLLEERGLEAVMTRVDDSTIELDERIEIANSSRGDLFLSIHVNWLGARTLRGIETFYLGSTDDPELNRRASLENRNSGYTLTDFRQLLDGIYVDLRRDESRAFASHVHRSMLSAIKQQNPNLRDRGVKQAPFVVLVGTEMPAILAEVSALNNREEAALLRTDEYRATIALALADGIAAYATALQPDPPSPISNPAEGSEPGQESNPAETQSTETD